MKELPDKLSDLLELALSDIVTISGDERYTIEMGEWHNPSGDGEVCAVCLAGSVMANTLGVDPSMGTTPSQFSYELGRKLTALDALRTGMVSTAHLKLSGVILRSHFKLDRHVTSYDDNPVDWYIGMVQLVKDLREVGE